MPKVEETTLKFEVAEAKDAEGEWIVEAIAHYDEGQVYMARFSGPNARGRAIEYADWKNGS